MKLKAALLFTVFMLAGCGQMLNSFKQQKTLEESRSDITNATIRGGVNISYPEPSIVTITASGNSSPSIIVGAHKGMVVASKKENKSADERHSARFSIDEFVESVPEWAWPVLIFSLATFLVVYIFWSKTTATGRATDSLLAGGIDLAKNQIDIMKEELINMKPGSGEFNAMKKVLDRTQDDLSQKLEQKRPGR